ncbi:hypothetical protein ACLMAL_34500 [Nocardia sp. CWNU-33]|uniref:hypothetical protein n=1 Tax=Nocardia sp. CWNU-33 TaxID=3392117 RepID=UPI00398F3E30
MDDRLPLAGVIDSIERSHPGNAPAQLSEAAIVAARFMELADRLIGHFVAQARQAGVPWAEIGVRFGISRQAAQKRFAARAAAAVTGASNAAQPQGAV